MKIGNFEPSILLVAALFIIQIFATTISGDEALIIKSCNHTSLPDYCIALLESDKRSFSTDLFGLLNISIHLSLANATDTYKFINETLLPNATDPPRLRQCLEECRFEYSGGIDALSTALVLMDKRDYFSMNANLNVAVDVKFYCEDIFIQFNVPVPPTLLQRNDVMFNLTGVTVDLGDLLH